MKIAICLHGKYNNRLSPYSGDNGGKYLKEIIFDQYRNYEIDVFIHSWDSDLGVRITKIYQKFLKKSVFEAQIDFKEIILRSGIDDQLFNPPNQQQFRTCANSLSFFYSRKMAIELKTNYEKENGFKYDAVITSRFDLGQIDHYNGSHPYKVSEINFNPEFNMNHIYSAMWDQLNCGYADQWFYSNSENIDKIAGLYEKSPDFSLIFPPPLQPSGLAFFLGHYNKSVVFRYGLLLLEGVRCFVVRNIHNLINFLYIKANFRWNSVSFFSFFMS